MSGNEPVFRWDAYGISAYDASWFEADGIKTISGINPKKFVRFDKHGIYGINNVEGVNGSSWYPTGKNYNNDPNEEINDKATFALTWEGLKVQNTNGAMIKIGDNAKVD
jgi:hypothetical protein